MSKRRPIRPQTLIDSQASELRQLNRPPVVMHRRRRKRGGASVDDKAGTVGVNYGLLGDNLPAPSEVVALLQSRQITKVRIFEPNPSVLKALAGSGIQVIVGMANQDLQKVASDVSNANAWVQTNVVPFTQNLKFRCVSAGNEVIPGDLANFVFPAMVNLRSALDSANLPNIPVSTAVASSVLGASFPPSQGKFADGVSSVMAQITNFLEKTGSPLLANIYPYFAFNDNQNTVSLSYATFQSNQVVVQDGTLGYKNMFDAMVDATYSALEKAGGSNIEVVVSETGWPSNGNGQIATISNAMAYNGNLAKHVSDGSGTPKRPGKNIETYIFAMFNEDQKPAGTEQNFGLYYPNKNEVYHIDLP
ncbi:hypothetical protein ACFE04_011666 [Oxalis oulophora]